MIRKDLHLDYNNVHLEALLANHCPTDFQPPTLVDWPKHGKEVDYYKPTSDYLHGCLERARLAYLSASHEAVARCAMGILFTNHFRWFYYDRVATDHYKTIRTAAIGGCLLSEKALAAVKGNTEAWAGLSQSDFLDWEHLVTFTVVKSRLLDAVLQAATYCRRILASQPNRVATRFVLVICPRMEEGPVYGIIGETDRAGMYLTRSYDLRDDLQSRFFSCLLAGFYHSSTDAHGYNRRLRFHTDGSGAPVFKVWSPSGTWFGVQKVLCNRIHLWSRCTRAFLLTKDTPPSYKDAHALLGQKRRLTEDGNEEVNVDLVIQSSATGSKRPRVLQSSGTSSKYSTSHQSNPATSEKQPVSHCQTQDSPCS